MAIWFAVLLAFVAGFLVRSFLDQDDDHDLSTEVEQHYGDSRFRHHPRRRHVQRDHADLAGCQFCLEVLPVLQLEAR